LLALLPAAARLGDERHGVEEICGAREALAMAIH
jgi:hypothetical protein